MKSIFRSSASSLKFKQHVELLLLLLTFTSEVIPNVVDSNTESSEEKDRAFGVFEDDKEFCYSNPECGPTTDLWPGICQTGTHQSPISLPSYGPVLPGGVYLHQGTYKSSSFRMRNSGHSVVIEFRDPTYSNSSKPVGLSNYQGTTGSAADYRLDTAHFHWGSEDGVGSEHVYDGGRSFSMEVHLVHFRSNYTSTAAALASTDSSALAVIGIMLNVGQGNATGISQLAPVIQNLDKVKRPSSTGRWTFVSAPLDLTSLLPGSSGQNHLYTYKGSLTTPSCDEKVNWFVSSRAGTISHNDVQQFRYLTDGNGETLIENHRPLQAKNGRTVYITPVATI